jgi:hypothetical protein
MLSGMDRANLECRLARADKHIADGVRHIAQQTGIIRGMERLGQDVRLSRLILQTFEANHSLYVAERDKLLSELNA